MLCSRKRIHRVFVEFFLPLSLYVFMYCKQKGLKTSKRLRGFVLLSLTTRVCNLLCFTLRCFSEEELSYNKNQKLSREEEVFLCHLLTLGKCTARQQLLREIADCMYGKRIRQLDPKPSPTYAAGENMLSEKGALYLQTQMEHLHYSVTQMAFNMAKITGNIIIPFCFICYYLIFTISSFSLKPLQITLSSLRYRTVACRISSEVICFAVK